MVAALRNASKLHGSRTEHNSCSFTFRLVHDVSCETGLFGKHLKVLDYPLFHNLKCHCQLLYGRPDAEIIYYLVTSELIKEAVESSHWLGQGVYKLKWKGRE